MSGDNREGESEDFKWWKPRQRRFSLSVFFKLTFVSVLAMAIFAYGLTNVQGDSLTCLFRNVVVGIVLGAGIGTFLTFYKLTNFQGGILVLIPWPILILLMC